MLRAFILTAGSVCLLIGAGVLVASIPSLLALFYGDQDLFTPTAILSPTAPYACARGSLSEDDDPAFRTLEKARAPAQAVVSTTPLPSTPLAGPEIARPPVAPGAVILAFHRVGSNRSPALNARIQQFDHQLSELKSGKFTAAPVIEIVRRMKAGQPIDPLTVGVTIDDVHSSILKFAWPRLKKARFPFTIFVNTDAVGARPDSLNWAQLRSLVDEGVDVGCHTAAHGHMVGFDERYNTRDLVRCVIALREELGVTPKLFSYPYGEASADIRSLIETFGLDLIRRHAPEAIARFGESTVAKWRFEAAFTQTPGVVHAKSDPYLLPRFVINEANGRPGRFKQIVRALPLPTSIVEPSESLLPLGASGRGLSPTTLSIELTEEGPEAANVRCFHFGEPARAMKAEGRRLILSAVPPTSGRRGTWDCIAPSPDGRIHWFGALFVDSTRPENKK